MEQKCKVGSIVKLNKKGKKLFRNDMGVDFRPGYNMNSQFIVLSNSFKAASYLNDCIQVDVIINKYYNSMYKINPVSIDYFDLIEPILYSIDNIDSNLDKLERRFNE